MFSPASVTSVAIGLPSWIVRLSPFCGAPAEVQAAASVKLAVRAPIHVLLVIAVVLRVELNNRRKQFRGSWYLQLSGPRYFIQLYTGIFG